MNRVERTQFLAEQQQLQDLHKKSHPQQRRYICSAKGGCSEKQRAIAGKKCETIMAGGHCPDLHVKELWER